MTESQMYQLALDQSLSDSSTSVLKESKDSEPNHDNIPDTEWLNKDRVTVEKDISVDKENTPGKEAMFNSTHTSKYFRSAKSDNSRTKIFGNRIMEPLHNQKKTYSRSKQHPVVQLDGCEDVQSPDCVTVLDHPESDCIMQIDGTVDKNVPGSEKVDVTSTNVTQSTEMDVSDTNGLEKSSSKLFSEESQEVIDNELNHSMEDFEVPEATFVIMGMFLQGYS